MRLALEGGLQDFEAALLALEGCELALAPADPSGPLPPVAPAVTPWPQPPSDPPSPPPGPFAPPR